MELSMTSLAYIFYRFSPFILVCFFVLGSIINGEPKGFIYLVGLVFTCVMSGVLVDIVGDDVTNTAPVCTNLSINGVRSKTPYGMIIFAFTFFYLIYPISKYKLELENIPTLIFFPLLILADIYWNTYYNCFPMVNLIAAFIVAGGIGVFYAFIIDKTKIPSLQYYNVGVNRERCTKASRSRFKCTTYKNGKPVNYQVTQ